MLKLRRVIASRVRRGLALISPVGSSLRKTGEGKRNKEGSKGKGMGGEEFPRRAAGGSAATCS